MTELGRRRFLSGLGAVAALSLALPARPLPARAPAAAAIYQRIWDVDQAGNGLPALRPGEARDPRRGWVVVHEKARADAGAHHRLFDDVYIPEPKRLTYELARQLFDSYRLDQTKPDRTTPERARETRALLDAVEASGPMAAAREHLEQLRDAAFSDAAWRALLHEIWFRPFDDGRNLDLSGFEHVMVGEQKRGTVSGYHFWYKYWLDDSEDALGGDTIEYHGTRYDGLEAIGHDVPEIVTLAYRWHAQDFETGETRPLFKPIGGFWVGCSVEGLMALGTLRFFARGAVEAEINGVRYALELHRSPDGRSVRTFYPRLLGRA